ncbi:MAG: type III-B CRISPR-associated protein Cas10/Cmr2 [Verrucomicrobiia bacterium]
MKLQIGPVQEFIAQARSTRDLWSGSYLISWLMAHAVQLVAQGTHKTDAVIFPCLQQQPLCEWLKNPNPDLSNADAVLTPNLPNIFLVEVPEPASADALAKQAAKEFQFGAAGNGPTEWKRICDACLRFLEDHDAPLSKKAKERWEAQVSRFWQVTWQTWPMLDGAALTVVLETLPPDVREFCRSENWSANYQLVSHRLDARRQTRDFAAWDSLGLAHKDFFSGKEEVVIDAAWLAKARKSSVLRHLFRNDDELGAINLIKRVWHRAYLAETKKLKRARFGFESVPDVAAMPWRAALQKKLLSESGNPNVKTTFCEFVLAVQDAKSLLEPELASSIPVGKAEWHKVDSSIYNPSTWDSNPKAVDEEPLRRAGVALSRLTEAAGLGQPGRYYAVLAFDGDEMGKWISGEKTRGSVNRDFHQQFSAKLSQFALKTVRRLVEEEHHGELIYAGGDDVLALLPATEAIHCARALASGFREIQIDGGYLTASVGLAIGHVKEPLQDMIHEAQAAEKRAKADPEREAWNRQEKGLRWQFNEGWNRDALAVTLFKRSGETVRWGAKYSSGAFALLNKVQTHYWPPLDDPNKEMPISGKFPHRVAELLGRYSINQPLDESLCNIAKQEIDWIIRQQTWTEDKARQAGSRFERAQLEQRCHAYLDELLAFRWKRRPSDNQETVAPRPLREFINLFLIEAFIGRQGD